MLISRLPQLEQGYSLDLDSMIFSRHGTQQQGAAIGYHPRRPGRLSHHPLLALVAVVGKLIVRIRSPINHAFRLLQALADQGTWPPIFSRTANQAILRFCRSVGTDLVTARVS
jgi:hypothetical protein